MTYQCDSSLGGAPDPTDCEKLSWSGLKPPDSIETLQANVPKFYSQGMCCLSSITFPRKGLQQSTSTRPISHDTYSGTCALGISSAFSTTITWAHLLDAFKTLYNLCVENPITSVKGGRAYFGQQTISSWINGKRDSVGGVNGSEALPLGINATVFRHDSSSNMSCEWTLAQENKNITMCEAG